MDTTLITREGLARLQDELEQLRTVERRELAERIRHAASTDANVAENADYNAAQADQALLERRIALLEEQIASARVVAPDALNGMVDVGERVRLRHVERGEELECELVGPLEADPLAGRVSSVSPLGRALLGRRPGDTVTVEAPAGLQRYEVLAIEAVVVSSS